MSLLGKRRAGDDPENGKKRKTFDFQDVAPFDMLVTSPPIVYYSNYCKMTAYASNKIQNTTQEPFEVNKIPMKLLDDFGLAEDTMQCWRSIMELLNSSCDLKSMWNKIADVDSIICLLDSSENTALITEGQLELWWIKQVRSWFSKVPKNVENSYPKLGMNALIIESFYRFIWARCTCLQYLKQEQTKTSKSSHTMQVDLESDQNGEEEEIVEADDMGISEEEEEDENEEKTQEDEMELESQNDHPSETMDHYINEDGYLELPNVVDLFFKQNLISKTFDEIESQFFENVVHSELPNAVDKIHWNIEPAIHHFVTLCVNQSKEQNSLAPSQAQTSKSILAKLLKLYLKRHVPFLRKLGIYVNPNSPFVSNLKVVLSSST